MARAKITVTKTRRRKIDKKHRRCNVCKGTGVVYKR